MGQDTHHHPAQPPAFMSFLGYLPASVTAAGTDTQNAPRLQFLSIGSGRALGGH
jgi:hypothetical protein